MNEQQERLSGLLDDWKGDRQDQALLDQLLADVNQRALWQRYRMIGDALRHDLPQYIQPDFSASVMARIEQMDAPSGVSAAEAERRSVTNGWFTWLRPAAGLSLAVAVAFVAVTTLNRTPGGQDRGSQVMASATPSGSDPRIEQLANLPVLAPSVKVAAGSRVAASSVSASPPVADGLEVRRSNTEVRRKLNGYLVDHNQYAGSLQGIIPQVRVVVAPGQ